MRVIAGAAKGTRLAPVPPGTRPLSDRAREGLFSSLGPEVEGARCADLYAGTGAMGIEALSRGAERAVFVDASQAAVRAIKENLSRTGLGTAAEVHRADVRRFLAAARGRFGVVFADPPYARPVAEIREVLSLLSPNMLVRGATVVLTRAVKGDTDVIPVHLRVAKTLRYGDSLVLFIREDARARERSVPGDL